MGDPKKMSWENLFERFESDIRYDCHSLTAKFERSSAQEELFKRGKESLRPIIGHLQQRKEKNNFPLLDEDMTRAWAMLLNRIEIEIDPETSGPQDLSDLKGWLEWAERFAV